MEPTRRETRPGLQHDDPRDPAGPKVGDEPVRPPLVLLAIATAMVAGSALLLFGSGKTVDLIGWALATLLTTLAVAGFRTLDSRRRSRRTYVVPLLAQRIPPRFATAALLVLGTAVGGVHVWRFAGIVARQ
jgi:hypothetical protein